VDSAREHDEFRRMKIVEKIEKHKQIIATYLSHMAYWHDEINKSHNLLGRIAERLGEPEPEES
jgi:hypothetical protein